VLPLEQQLPRHLGGNHCIPKVMGRNLSVKQHTHCSWFCDTHQSGALIVSFIISSSSFLVIRLTADRDDPSSLLRKSSSYPSILIGSPYLHMRRT
jgi:hypothetical protein